MSYFGWGNWGSSTLHARYFVKLPAKSRRLCRCGCRRRSTHSGMANGVVLVTGCELSVRRWVKIGRTVFVKQTKVNCKG